MIRFRTSLLITALALAYVLIAAASMGFWAALQHGGESLRPYFYWATFAWALVIAFPWCIVRLSKISETIGPLWTLGSLALLLAGDVVLWFVLSGSTRLFKFIGYSLLPFFILGLALWVGSNSKRKQSRRVDPQHRGISLAGLLLSMRRKKSKNGRTTINSHDE
ncbi:MAG: hypothetical protein GY847_11205 [Proteobacteria bacterium]|nr:hypothetical protein [Pseudomonadota bacterium]